MSADVIEQIKQRLSLVDVVRTKAPDIKRKGRDHWACCPFHKENTPSFSVNEEKGFYHCFGCGVHGDMFTFVQEQDGLDFPTALKKLADIAGVTLPERPQQQQARDAKTPLYSAMAAAQALFQQQYTNSTAAQYVNGRGITLEAIQHFGLGFAAESWDKLVNTLVERGHKESTLREVGLTKQGKQGRGDYDAFRNRLMFPIYDLNERAVAFGGRVLSKDDEPKYLNSPESPIFYKGRQLYNLAGARTAIREAETALVVEGYTDVIALWMHGFKNAVAPLGTAITPEQVQTLWKHCALPTICLDGDAAGQRAAQRVAERVLPILKPGHSLQFIWLPQGEDPDSLLNKQGAGAFNTLLKTPQPLEQVLWQVAQQAGSLDTAAGRSAIEQRSQELLKQVQDGTVRKHLGQLLKDQLWQSTRQFGKVKGLRKKGAQAAPEMTGVPLERLLLITACQYVNIARQFEEEVAELTLSTPSEQRLQKKICEFLVQGVDDEQWPPYLEESGMANTLAELSKSCLIEQLLDPAADVAQWWLATYRQYQQRHQQQLKQAWATYRAEPNEANWALVQAAQRR